ncbi:hypothetical protein [Streptomyces sp. NPDC052494]|uniref:hypothetical protein n=1 Tax=Streptomyces sp. NPDC052494 TaxID=3365692 RepID=UPI0037D5A614
MTRGGIVLFPHTVIEQFTDDQVNTWHTHFADNGAHERSRRIEDDNGCRRIVHCRYQCGGRFVLRLHTAPARVATPDAGRVVLAGDPGEDDRLCYAEAWRGVRSGR